MKGHQIQTSKMEESPCAGVAAGRRSKEISMKKSLKISGKSLNRQFYAASLDSPSDNTKRLSSSSMVSEILDSDQGSQTTENSVLESNQTLYGFTETRSTSNFIPDSKMTFVAGESGALLSVLNFANANPKSIKLVVDALVNEVIARLYCLPEEEKDLVVAAKGRVALYCCFLWSFAVAVAIWFMGSGSHRSYHGLPPT